MNRVAKLNKSVSNRWKRLGDVGEELSELLLVKNGFTNVRNLNHHKMNFAFADFYAERNGEKYVISVKARNKYKFRCEGTKKINPRYNLGSKCYKHAEVAEIQFNSKAAWLTISLDSETYSAYFGMLSSMNGSRGVNMTEKAIVSYLCLAKNVSHKLNYDELKNVYEIAE